jgi:hypothetical protein
MIREHELEITELQKKVNEGNNNHSNVTSDWNAKKGEAGYIKNKPFGIVTQMDQSIEIEDNINYENGTGVIKFKRDDYEFKILQQSNLGSVTTIYNDCSESNYIILWNSDYLMPEEYLSFKRKYKKDDYYVHEYEIGNTYESDDRLREEVSKALKTLTYVYDDGSEGFTKIPQSMVNMPYVDPIVWKYICNPLIITTGLTMDKYPELIDPNTMSLKYKIPAMYRMIYNCDSPDFNNNSNFANIPIIPSRIEDYLMNCYNVTTNANSKYVEALFEDDVWTVALMVE